MKTGWIAATLLVGAPGCAAIRVEPEGALDTLAGDVLVVIAGVEAEGPPALMINAKKAEGAFEAGAEPARVCERFVAELKAAEGVGRVECLPLAGAPKAFAPSPELRWGLGKFDVPVPAKGTPVVRGDFAPPWVLIVDALYIGYEHRSAGQNGSYPVVQTHARVVWWSNGDGRAVAWGEESTQVRTAGWLAPADITASVDEAVSRLARKTARHSGLDVD